MKTSCKKRLRKGFFDATLHQTPHFQRKTDCLNIYFHPLPYSEAELALSNNELVLFNKLKLTNYSSSLWMRQLQQRDTSSLLQSEMSEF